MKLLLTLFIMWLGVSSGPLYAASTPLDPVPSIKLMKTSDVEKVTGKKLSLWDRVKFELAKKVMMIRMKDRGQMTEKQRKQGILSMIMGITSIVFLVLPGIGILVSLPLAILAVIFGIISLKGNTNAKGIVGIVTGGVVLLLFMLAILIIMSWGFY